MFTYGETFEKLNNTRLSLVFVPLLSRFTTSLVFGSQYINTENYFIFLIQTIHVSQVVPHLYKTQSLPDGVSASMDTANAYTISKKPHAPSKVVSTHHSANKYPERGQDTPCVWQAIPDESVSSFNSLLQKCKSIVEIDKSVPEINKLMVEKSNRMSRKCKW